MPVEYLNPESLHRPAGPYSHVAVGTQGRLAVIAGQIAFDRDGALVGGADAGAQFVQAFRNLMAAVDAAGASPSDILELRTFVVGAENLASFREGREAVFPEYFAGEYPASTLLVVAGLATPELRVEVAATVLVPDRVS